MSSDKKSAGAGKGYHQN